MQVGDIIREKYGSWLLWRIVDVYEPNSPLILAELCSTHKFHKPGKRQLLFKCDYQREPDPQAFAAYRGFTVDA